MIENSFGKQLIETIEQLNFKYEILENNIISISFHNDLLTTFKVLIEFEDLKIFDYTNVVITVLGLGTITEPKNSLYNLLNEYNYKYRNYKFISAHGQIYMRADLSVNKTADNTSLFLLYLSSALQISREIFPEIQKCIWT